MLILKKIIKGLCWILLIVFTFLIVAAIVANGGAGDKAQYYYLKGAYHVFNPKSTPLSEIVIDLKQQDSDFIINDIKSTGWLYPFGWWSFAYPKTEEEMELEKRVGLQTLIPGNPFEYFKVKIIWEDGTAFTIEDAKVVSLHFKDYKNPASQIKYPTERGINSVQIFCIDGHPVLENGHFLQRRTDYEFAFAQHQKLAFMLTDLGFARDVHEDANQKNIINKRLEKFGGRKCLEYKTWTKGNFEFTLILELFDSDYMNSVYINPKDKL